jgi:SAM-dependent methyltransferase
MSDITKESIMSKQEGISLRCDIPAWALKRPKSILQSLLDFLAAPLRMVLLPDHVCESMHITSLRSERFAVVLPQLRGRLLDVGAGDNTLVSLYKLQNHNPEAQKSIGVEVFDWGGGCVIVEQSDVLPFPNDSFDTVTFIACLNHIPERVGALAEALRVLRPGGRVVITMIGPVIGKIGHALWWYSEDKHRDVDEEEEMGMSNSAIMVLLKDAGFVNLHADAFVYGLNHLFVAEKPLGD